ncbi:vitamin K epoxide reductase family protein [uncultured Psychroserpens sp.]|uniref:vitamin K epoxide reductase family protein n=1 Tax=uncultured Psychroserpens sp. TaxID=255436 RepID=UPI0026136D1E|nr:vitamin K epoxide reductase family protein [uncultured Psychroserpens sp.]
MKDTLSYLVWHLLKTHKIRVDFEELTFQIKSHPTYPSLHAVTGVLDHFNIENLALDIPKSVETLKQLPTTFLAQIEEDNEKAFVVVSKTKNTYKLVSSKKEVKTESASNFLNQFTGIVLAVEKDKIEVKSDSHRTKTLIIQMLAISTLILCSILLFISTNSIISTLFLCLSLVGAYLTKTILKQEQGEATILGNAFCSNTSEKKNCDAVLSSKGATVVQGIKLSDLSFMYFTGLTLANVLLIINNSALSILMLVSLIALPITVYSIYYQALVIKKWCFLCLSVVALMWMQSSISAIFFEPVFELKSLITVLLSFTVVSSLWLVQSKFQKDNKSLIYTKLEFFKFKRNFQLFNNQLSKSKTINTRVKNTEEITFGNPNSDLQITIITNPLCGHCKPVHKLVEQIIRLYSQTIKLTLRFNVSTKNPENRSVQIATRLLEIYYTEGPETCMNALHEIYGNSLPDDWFKEWQYCSEPSTYLSTLERTYNWCTDNAINFTPEILINGKAYPTIFNRSDLEFFIEDLIEQSATDNKNVEFLPIQEA